MAYTAPSIVASGETFAELQSDGLAGHLARLIAAQAATAAPTVAATWTATGGGSTGGSLAAGTYYGVVTETNGIGETTISPQQTQITVSATNIPRITFQTLKTGNTARNVYIGAVGGSTGGPYYLYATGITASTYDLSAAAPANSYAVNPPTVNSTGLTYIGAQGATMNTALQYLRSLTRNPRNVSRAWEDAVELLGQFLRGEAIPFNQLVQKLRHSHTFVAALNTLLTEVGTLADANPGHFTTTVNAIGNRKNVRAWP